MAGIYGNQPRKLIPRVISANTTLTGYDLKGPKNTIVLTGTTARTVTLPTPIKDLEKVLTYLVNASTAAMTFSCSSGFVGGYSSVVLDAKSSATLQCVPVSVSAWGWSIQGAGSALVTGLAETTFDTVAAMFANGTHTNITITPQDGDNTFDFTATGMDVASTDVTDWATAFLSELQTVLEASSPVGLTWSDEDASVAYGTEPGAVATSTSGQAGTADSASRSDHNHDLGEHDHSDATKGGTITSASVSDFDTAAVSATAAEYCADDDVRLPTDWATFDPTPATWTSGTPGSLTEVYRYRQVNDTVSGIIYITTTDGDGKTPVSFTMPVAPTDISANIEVKATQIIDGTPTDMFGYIDSSDGLLKFNAADPWTDATTCSLRVKFEYEVTLP